MPPKRPPGDWPGTEPRHTARKVDAVWAGIENKRLTEQVVEQNEAAKQLDVPTEFDALLPKESERWG